ncbi:MAG: 50S ribosomal protein L29 [Candidatus Nomurabacteria bacterium]|jgi:ribosomal protein L29|nr:50S ribosomal protein L29 [Candidatus Nomurabacteria bacterium]
MAEEKTLTLQEQLLVKKAEYIDAKKRLYSEELANPHIIKSIKKDIARICTKIASGEKVKEGK